jgi:hypothetical protein
MASNAINIFANDATSAAHGGVLRNTAKGANSMKRIDGRVAVFTVAAQGIGEGIVRRLAIEGAQVVVADLNGAKAEEVAASLRGEGRQAIAAAVDVAERA